MKHVICGLQRSGNHAIINWYMAHLDDVLFWNNIVKKGRPTQASFKGEPPFKHEIHSYENIHPDDVLEEGLETKEWADQISIILRDPYNWLASLYKFQMKEWSYTVRSRPLEEFLDLWVMMAEYTEANPRTLINYNKWVKNPNYRRMLENRWGFGETDDTIDKISGYGGGSTFEGFDKKAEELDVFNRWKAVRHEPEYRKLILSNTKVKEISERMFNFSPTGLYNDSISNSD
jgi:hypothetical protein